MLPASLHTTNLISSIPHFTPRACIMRQAGVPARVGCLTEFFPFFFCFPFSVSICTTLLWRCGAVGGAVGGRGQRCGCGRGRRSRSLCCRGSGRRSRWLSQSRSGGGSWCGQRWQEASQSVRDSDAHAVSCGRGGRAVRSRLWLRASGGADDRRSERRVGEVDRPGASLPGRWRHRSDRCRRRGKKQELSAY